MSRSSNHKTRHKLSSYLSLNLACLSLSDLMSLADGVIVWNGIPRFSGLFCSYTVARMKTGQRNDFSELRVGREDVNFSIHNAI